jgi:thiosulfate/3-mercaptopyruvate sulfurtransferase
MLSEPVKELFEGMGIGDDTLVITYDHSGSLYSTRVWWVLNYYGHTNVKVLNGGWRKWVEEGRPISLDRAEEREVTFTPRAQDDLVCTLDYGVAHVNDPDVVFLDVRSDGEWDGSNDRGNKRAGHVPGAVHIEWLNFITNDKHRMFKPAAELRAMLEEAGVTPEKEVVTY